MLIDDSALAARHHQLWPLETAERELLDFHLAHPGVLHPRDVAVLRYALAWGRLLEVRDPLGIDLSVESWTAPLRDRLGVLLREAGLSTGRPDALAIERLVTPAALLTRHTRARVQAAIGSRVRWESVEKDLTERALVLACGGGGGSGHVNLGAFALLETLGIRPRLIVGASMGAIVGLFRARSLRFDVTQVPRIMGELHHRSLFRPYALESRWTLPSPVRLALRDGIGPYFEYDGIPLRLRDLAIPLLVVVAGLRRGGRITDAAIDPNSGRIQPMQVIRTALELVSAPQRLRPVVLGEMADTRDLDAVDAVGLSSSVPGALHYELGRDAPAEVERLESLFARDELWRVTDGGVVDNVPARTAWNAVQRGLLGTRNACILALDGFAPRLASGLWLPLQHAAALNVRESARYAHLYHAFDRTLSPLVLLPSVVQAMRIVESAQGELKARVPLLKALVEPLPGAVSLDAVLGADTTGGLRPGASVDSLG